MKINLFYLLGNWQQRKSVLSQIKEKIGEYELFVYDETYRLEETHQQISENSIFSKYKLVIFKNWPLVGYKKLETSLLTKFKKMLSDIPSDCCIVLDNLKTDSSKFKKFVEENGKIYKFDQVLPGYKIKGYILKYFGKYEKEIKPENLEEMINFVSPWGEEVNLDKLYMLLEKLNEYSGQRKIIQREDVVATFSNSSEFIIWNFFNALDKKSYPQFIKLLEVMISYAKDINMEINQIINTFLWRYRLLFMVKYGLIEKKKTEEIWGEISKLNKLERRKVYEDKKDSKKTSTERTSLKVVETGNKNSYSKGMFSSVLNGYRGSKAAIDCYTLKELLLINYALEHLPLRLRENCTEAEVILIFKLVCMVICGLIKNESNLDFLKQRDYFVQSKMSY